jgi:AcrR family transcriptional regulator
MKGKQAVITARRARRARPPPGDSAPRERLLQAAFTVFREHGFADASTLEIATRAQASKRDLYAVFDSKQAMLAACITERAHRMRQPLNLASEVPESREALEATLVQFGKSILRGLSDPDVLAVYRLAIRRISSGTGYRTDARQDRPRSQSSRAGRVARQGVGARADRCW